jgi:hypothetical protein
MDSLTEPDLLTVEDVSHMTYERAERCMKDGLLPTEAWEAYCYLFRDAAYRWSDLGKHQAARHAARFGLLPPYSDRPLPSNDDETEEHTTVLPKEET